MVIPQNKIWTFILLAMLNTAFFSERAWGQGVGPLIIQNIQGPYLDVSRPYYVKIYVNFITSPNNNWINLPLAKNYGEEIVQNLNSFYNRYNIYFVGENGSYCSGVSASTTQIVFNNTQEVSITGIRSAIPTSKHNDGIDIYIASFLGTATGYAFKIPNTYCELNGTTIDGVLVHRTTVLAHEIGHNLGLLHTFENLEFGVCSDNDVNGICNICGDNICDTPMPNTNSIILSADCSQIVSPPTANQILAKNLMHYVTPLTCEREITNEQAKRIKTYLRNSDILSAITLPNTTFSNSMTSWNTPQFPRTNVIVEAGQTLDISATVTMSKGAYIYVKKGGLLKVRALITSCKGFWEGIIIEGNSLLPQTPPQQGYVFVSNTGIIEHAKCGIKVQGFDSDGMFLQNGGGGGVVQVNGGVFKDNLVGIEFAPYDLPVNIGGQNFRTNKSSFNAPQFRTTSDYRGLSNEQPCFVKLKKVYKIQFESPKFEDWRTNNFTSFNGRSQAIDANNAAFLISNGRFSNLEKAINAAQLEATGSFYVSNCKFINCFVGISTLNVDKYTITNNIFKVQPPDFFNVSQPIPLECVGLDLRGFTAGFEISKNTFSGTYFTYDAKSTAIFVSGSGINNNVIAENKFGTLHAGVKVAGVNGYNSDKINNGLEFTCNETNQEVGNFYDYQILPNSVVRNPQGDANRPSGNVFGDFSEPPLNLSIKNENTTELKYYYFNGNITQKPKTSIGINKIGTDFMPNCGLLTCNPCPPPPIKAIKNSFEELSNTLLSQTQQISAWANLHSESPAVLYTAINDTRKKLDSNGQVILRYHSYLDSNGVGIDSILMWLGRQGTFTADVTLMRHYFFTKKFSEYDVLQSQILIKYNTKEELLFGGWSRLMELYDMLRSPLENGNSINELATNTLKSLTLIADYCDEAGIISQNILLQNGIKTLNPCAPISKYSSTHENSNTNVSEDDKLGVKLSPNPADMSLTIETKDDLMDKTILIIDAVGRKVWSQKITSNIHKVEIALHTVPNGVYFVKIDNYLPSSYIQKLIISH